MQIIVTHLLLSSLHHLPYHGYSKNFVFYKHTVIIIIIIIVS